MTAGGLAWAAVAIAVFCLLTVLPLAVSITLWIGAPEAVGYVASDGSVFLRAERGWIELATWRAENGLNPLIIGDEISKAPCAKKAETCELDLPAGVFSLAPGSEPVAEGCPSSGILRFVPRDGAPELTIEPCAYVGRGGAVIDAGWGRAEVRVTRAEGVRAWSAPLWESPKRNAASRQ